MFDSYFLSSCWETSLTGGRWNTGNGQNCGGPVTIYYCLIETPQTWKAWSPYFISQELTNSVELSTARDATR
jgi:hypothetical protein